MSSQDDTNPAHNMGVTETGELSERHATTAKEERRKLQPALCFIAFGMIILGMVLSAQAIVQILDTTPFLGTPVTEDGTPIPTHGYPELFLGLAWSVAWVIGLIVALLPLNRYRRRYP